jgi:hypothetical protein
LTRYTFAAGIALCGAANSTLAANLRVPQQFPTIQSAINAAAREDTILVAPGTYVENLLIDKPLTLGSTAGAESTVIDGAATGPVIIAHGTDSERVTIFGFTITNGLSTIDNLTANPSSSAGGVMAESMTVTIRNNIIRNNVGCMGSAISTSSATVTIERNQIIDNPQHASCDGANGGGIFLRADGRGHSLVAGNVVARHRVGGYGGGIATQNMNRLTIRDNIFSDNHAPQGYGGGLFLDGGSTSVSRNAFTGNSAASGGAMALFPSGNEDRAVAEGNLMTGNRATGDSSATLIMTALQQNLRFTDNIAEGDSAAELILCGMPGYIVAASNLLRNAGGQLLGGFCSTP